MAQDSHSPLHVLAGPCAVEGLGTTMTVAREVQRVCDKLGLPFHVKASYRKANRTRLDSFSGIGDQEALEVLAKVKSDLGVGIVTDIHHPEEAAMAAIMDGTVVRGDVVIVRYEGPKGGPGMREMLSPTSAINGRGLSQDVAMITDGRFSGGSHGFVIGHVTPEAHLGGPIALVQDGDTITVDADNAEVNLHVSDEELAARKTKWQAPDAYIQRGTLAKYATLVSSASEGAVTDKYLG